MRITITGTRAGLTRHQKLWAKEFFSNNSVTVIHGAADGVDSDIHNLVYESHLVDIYPANDVPSNLLNINYWHGGVLVNPRGPALRRNRTMVDKGDLVIGFPKNFYEELRSGTWAALRYANKTNKPYLIVWPNGDVGQLDKWH